MAKVFESVLHTLIPLPHAQTLSFTIYLLATQPVVQDWMREELQEYSIKLEL